MIYKGRLLLFDSVNSTNDVFPSNCDLTFPEVIPVIYDFHYNNSHYLLGTGKIERDDKGLIVTVNIPKSKEGLPLPRKIGLGGTYKDFTYGEKYCGISPVTKATLFAVSVTFKPVNKKYYAKRKLIKTLFNRRK